MDWAGVRRGALASCAVLSLVGLGIGGTFGVRAIDRRAAEALHATDHDVRFAWPAVEGNVQETWLPAGEQERLLRIAEDALAGTGPFDRAALRRVSARLAETGWFDAPPTVRREADGLVIVRGHWRVPAAVVRLRGRDHLVSWNRMPLPLVYDEGRSGLRHIVGAASAPGDSEPALVGGLPVPSDPWPGADVEGGLRLLGVLTGQGFGEQVVGIDVSRHRTDRKLEIITDRGTRVVWGAAPGEWLPDEQPTEVKLERLHQLRQQAGRIDGNVERIQVFGPQVVLDRTATRGGR